MTVPVAYSRWLCNEGSGSSAISLMYDRPLTVYCGWSDQAAEGDYCLSFDGVDQYAGRVNDYWGYFRTGFTLAARVFVSDWSAAQGDVCVLDYISQYGLQFGSSEFPSADHFGIWIKTATGGVLTASLDHSGLAAGWHDFIATWDGQYLKLHLDGSLATTTDYGSAAGDIVGDIAGDLILGARSAAGAGTPPTEGFFAGRLDDVGAWSLALFDSQVAEIYPLQSITRNVPPLSLPLTLLAPITSPRLVNLPPLSIPLAMLAPRFSPLVVNVPPLSIPLNLLAPLFNPYALRVPSLALSLALSTPRGVGQAGTPFVALPLTLLAPGVVMNRSLSVPLLVLQLAIKTPAWSWEIPTSGSYQQIYRLILTGAADGLADATLPISSFQARLRLSGQTYLQAVVPYTAELADQILERPNGTMIIRAGLLFADGSETITELLRAAMDLPTTDLGSRSGSLTLSGYFAAQPGSGLTRTLKGVRSLRSGPTNQAQASIDYFLRPGDIAIEPTTGSAIDVGLITYTYSQRAQTMTVSSGRA